MKQFMLTGLMLTAGLLQCAVGVGQQLSVVDQSQPPEAYENVHVHPLVHDSLSSAFVIWVKKEVKPHIHRNHTEQVYILEGQATMLLGNEVMQVVPGQLITIPKGTIHAVRVTGSTPLKVISLQSPYFDGSDREFVEASF